MKSFWIISILIFVSATSMAQAYLVRDQGISVEKNGESLHFPWVGGMNNPQFSTIDFNQDGKNDLFVFDKSGNIIIPFIQHAAPGQINFSFEPSYVRFFPKLHDWVLLRDFNCDNYPDIFSYSTFGPGAMVYQSNGQEGQEWFSIADSLLYSHYELGSSEGDVNIFISTIDLPAIYDVDEDGDLDIFTYQLQGSKVEFHMNFSQENEGLCGLEYELKNRCWGYFAEDLNSPEILLGENCTNVVDPKIAELQHHSGSTLLMLDINNDGFKELVMGDVSYSSLTTVVNGGPSEAGPDSITSVDYFFPNEDAPLILNNFPASFYVDVNNDDVNDFIAAPNSQYTSDNVNAVSLYLNNGLNDAPDLSFLQSDFLHKDMIDVGEGAYPVLIDIDQDGLQDLLIGNRKKILDSISTSTIVYYHNNGSLSDPSFEWISDDVFNLSQTGVGEALYPAFMDLDGDNALDMIIGNLNGELLFFINSANENEAMNFSGPASPLLDNNNIAIDVGQLAKVQTFDLNEDGLLDLVVGERSGRIRYFENTGNAGNAEFTWQTDTLGGIQCPGFLQNTGYSAPFFYLESGEVKVLLGSETGEILYFDNISANLEGVFDAFDGPASNLNEGKRTTVARHDLNNDGLPDLLIGNYRGGLSFFKGDTESRIAELPKTANFKLFPNPADNLLSIRFDDNKERNISFYNNLGQIIYMEDNYRNSEFSLDVSDWNNGQYIVKVNDGLSLSFKSLLIIH